MANVLIGTEPLVDYLLSGGKNVGALGGRDLADMAVSAVTIESLLAEAEHDPSLLAAQRRSWRSNLVNFRELVVNRGGECLALSHRALGVWGELLLMDLTHTDAQGQVEEMSTEERLVVATAVAGGLIYVTNDRDWNVALQKKFSLSLEIV